MALYLLGILAIPAAIILGTGNLQSQRPLGLLIAGAGVLVALIVMAQAAPRRWSQAPPTQPPPPTVEDSSPFVIDEKIRPKPRPKTPRIEEPEVERIFNVTAYAASIALASFALALALASPTWALMLLVAGAVWVVMWWPAAMRMFTLTSSILIARDRATVFEFVSDFRNAPKYYFMYDQTVEKVTPGPIGPGTEFRAHVNLRADVVPGIDQDATYEGTEKIIEFEPNRRLTSYVSSGRRPNLDTTTFEEVAGGTRVTHRFEHLSSYGSALSGTRLRSRATHRGMRANRHAAWARAKQILESHGETTT